MNRLLTAFAIAAIVALTAPTTIAVDATYTRTGTLQPVFSGYAVQSANDYTINLAAGTQLDLTLAWATLDDLDIVVIPPGGSCALLPDPDTACIVNGAQNRVNCDGRVDGGFPLSPSPETATYVAPVSGTYTISIQAGFAVPLVSGIPYTLTVEATGTHDPLSSTFQAGNYVKTGACRYLP